MTDINGKTIHEGQFVKITGCKVKNDNGIYIVNKQYEKGDYCLYKVNQDGSEAKTKYNIFFLDDRHDKDKEVTIISKEELKQAAKDVKNYLNGVTSSETVHTFSRSDTQEATPGKYIKFVKPILLRGHINSFTGLYEIVRFVPDGSVILHLMGKKGEQIADNINGYYQYSPITLSFTPKIINQLFNDNYIEILERTSTTKGEISATNEESEPEQEATTATIQAEETTTAEEAANTAEQKTETTKEVKEFCKNCACYGVDCTGYGEPWTGCVYFRKIGEPEKQTINTVPEEQKAEGVQANTITAETAKEEQETQQQEQTNEQSQQEKINIKPKYYTINETAARRAQEMWSFYDYVKDNETRVYKKAVDDVYKLVEEVAIKKPERLTEALTIADRFARKYADWKNTGFSIELMCPSVLICGAGNFPVRKKEKQNQRRDKHQSEYNYIMDIPTKIKNILSDKGIIKSNDTDAIQQLKNKLEKLEAEREAMKEHNKKARQNNGEILPAYCLQNIGQNIRNIEDRIKQLETIKEKPTEDITNKYNTSACRVVENTELMRMQLFFEGKPSEEVRDILKSNGFKWAPSQGAWQRQLTDNAKYSTKQALKQIDKLTEEQTA